MILPSAITGGYTYYRRGSVDLRAGVVLGLSGALTAVLGAWLTQFAGGKVVLLATAALVLYTAVDMVLQVLRARRARAALAEGADAPRGRRASSGRADLGPARRHRRGDRSLLRASSASAADSSWCRC